MKLSKNINMKEILAQSLYILMNEKSFDKITIKQIAEKSGVIRGTFYNHFYDKYETHEYLTHMLLFENNLDPDSDYFDMINTIFSNIEEHKDFVRKSFKIEGQYQFEEILSREFTELIKGLNYNLSDDLDKDYFIESLSHSIVFQIKYWNKMNYKYTAKEITDMFYKYQTVYTQEFFKNINL